MIDVKRVSFTYPNGTEALREVSIRVRDGEFLAVMGQNGAGKTTLVKLFNGLLKPTSGKVLVDNVNTKDTSVAKLARSVGFVFQNPDNQLFCETVEEEISFALRNFGFDESRVKRRVTWALNLLGLNEYRKTSPFMLSGGERKRVALASVLAWDPKVVVMDEPTIGQDHRQKEKLRQFIIQLNSQGKTVVIVTHDVEFVAECAPRIVLMSSGRIVAEGSSKEILTDPETLTKASIVVPQITQVFMGLADLGFQFDVIDLLSAKKLLSERLIKK
ncbi:MAG: ATP-binding cassette domain-containing protein [Candidatus Bathyarchaeia archaeon]